MPRQCANTLMYGWSSPQRVDNSIAATSAIIALSPELKTRHRHH